jgi:4-hydroxy-tetrahydrodipicolinate reductase
MRIGLIGFGKMGKMVASLAAHHHIEVVSILQKVTHEIDPSVQVYIDFSTSGATLQYIPLLAKKQIPHVIGTTGWNIEIPRMRTVVEEEGGTVLYSPNFSLGIALFTRLLQKTCEIMHPFSNEYEKVGLEIHHNKKKDTPSGTAKMLTEKFRIPFSSVRVGSFPGTHEVIFDSPNDTITLSHSARGREGFANGALKAADWIKDKKGWFTFDDMLDSLYSTDYALSSK